MRIQVCDSSDVSWLKRVSVLLALQAGLVIFPMLGAQPAQAAPASSTAPLAKIQLDLTVKYEGIAQQKVITVTEGSSTSLTIASTDGKSSLKLEVVPTLKPKEGSKETFIKLALDVLRESTEEPPQQTMPKIVVQAGEPATVSMLSNSGSSIFINIIPTLP